MENRGRSVLEEFEHIISNTLLGEQAKNKLLANKIEPTRLVYCGQLYIMESTTEKIKLDPKSSEEQIKGLKMLDQLFCMSFSVKTTPREEATPCPDCGEVHEGDTETLEVSSVFSCDPNDAAEVVSHLMRNESTFRRIITNGVRKFETRQRREMQSDDEIISLLTKLFTK